MTQANPSPPVRTEGPDPVLGLGVALLGILVMGLSGAATLHYVFNAGTVLTLVGAVMFVGSVTLSSLRRP
jgi:hypothetical protein